MSRQSWQPPIKTGQKKLIISAVRKSSQKLALLKNWVLQLTLIEFEEDGSLDPYMFFQVPSSTRLEEFVQCSDVFFWLRNTAETQQCNDTVNAVFADFIVLGQNGLNTDGKNFVYVFQASCFDLFLELGMGMSAGLYAIDLEFTGSARFGSLLVRWIVKCRKDVYPESYTWPNIKYDARERLCLRFINDSTLGNAPLQECSNLRAVLLSNLPSHVRPERAKPSSLDMRPM